MFHKPLGAGRRHILLNGSRSSEATRQGKAALVAGISGVIALQATQLGIGPGPWEMILIDHFFD